MLYLFKKTKQNIQLSAMESSWAPITAQKFIIFELCKVRYYNSQKVTLLRLWRDATFFRNWSRVKVILRSVESLTRVQKAGVGWEFNHQICQQLGTTAH